MKQTLLLLAALCLISAGLKAQCPAHVKYTASKMEIYDSTMTLTDSKDVVTTFETTDKGFTGSQEGDEDVLQGTLKSATCDWKEAYVNGKMVMVCDITDPHETIENAMVTIEAVNGKITITMHAKKEYPNRIIRLPVDKYEEVK
jgi:hypothetical protein